jgi:hypothetical protein
MACGAGLEIPHVMAAGETELHVVRFGYRRFLRWWNRVRNMAFRAFGRFLAVVRDVSVGVDCLFFRKFELDVLFDDFFIRPVARQALLF